MFGLFSIKSLFMSKLALATFWQPLGTKWLLFIPTSGHSAQFGTLAAYFLERALE